MQTARCYPGAPPSPVERTLMGRRVAMKSLLFPCPGQLGNVRLAEAAGLHTSLFAHFERHGPDRIYLKLLPLTCTERRRRLCSTLL